MYWDVRRTSRMNTEIRFLDNSPGRPGLPVDTVHYNRPYLARAYAG